MTKTTPSPLKVALLGRPNVGKSTLFNRLIRSNRAITHDRPGVTRDRMQGIVRSRSENPFILIDTGGVTLDSHAHIEPGPEGIRGFEAEILQQATDAALESNLLCLVVDGRDGLTPLDRHLADYLRKKDKTLLLVINKVDGPEKAELLSAEFYSLGLDVITCSAAHGYNVRQLEEEILSRLYFSEYAEEDHSADAEECETPLLDGATKRQIKKLKTPGYADTAEETEGSPADTAPCPVNTAAEPDGDLTVGGPAFAENEAAAEQKIFLPGEADFASELLPSDDNILEQPDVGGPIKLAFLGRPNVGKSSLVNALVGEKRMIVSDVAGTTRDSVDVSLEIDGEEVTFVDTAGVRRRAKITDIVERYSVNSSLKSTTKAHVTLLVLDAAEGLTLQDKRLIDLLNERKTPFMVLINKSDLIEAKQRKEAEKLYRQALVFCPHVPVLFVSAQNRHNLRKIVPLAVAIRRECAVRVPTGRLNRAMTAVLERHQPPIIGNTRAKFFYLTQAESRPPTFVFFVNNADRVLTSYARYLERSLRKIFGIKHAPMRVHFRSSHSPKGGKKVKK